MSRRVFDRPSASGGYRSFVRKGRTAIPQNDGRARFLEALILLSVMVALAIAMGFTVALPLMLLLSDICAKLKC